MFSEIFCFDIGTVYTITVISNGKDLKRTWQDVRPPFFPPQDRKYLSAISHAVSGPAVTTELQATRVG